MYVCLWRLFVCTVSRSGNLTTPRARIMYVCLCRFLPSISCMIGAVAFPQARVSCIHPCGLIYLYSISDGKSPGRRDVPDSICLSIYTGVEGAYQTSAGMNEYRCVRRSGVCFEVLTVRSVGTGYDTPGSGELLTAAVTVQANRASRGRPPTAE